MKRKIFAPNQRNNGHTQQKMSEIPNRYSLYYHLLTNDKTD